MGPRTGRAAGYCAGYGAPGYANPIPSRGVGWGRGRGFGRGLGLGFRGGWGWGGYRDVPYGPAPTREQEADALKSQAEYFEGALEDTRKRIAELESEKK
jgi:hypothetical protein